MCHTYAMGELPGREYVLYLRKSRGRSGIARQRTITTAHIERLGGTVAGEYTDTDRTAYRQVGAAGPPQRDDFARMLADLPRRPGLGVAAWHADRLTRNSGDTEALIEVCAAGGHPVETPRGGSYDLGTANGRKRLRADALDASYEVDHMTERIVAAKNEAAAAGMWLGGRRSFGYGPDGVTICHHELVVTEAEAQRRGLDPLRMIPTHRGERALVVLPYDEAAELAAMAAAVLAGESVHAIARGLNARGVRTASGRPWPDTEVRKVLLKPRNAGLMTHRGEITGPAVWPAILDELTWRKVRTILTDPARRTTPGPARRWLGSGLYLCGVCGSPVFATATGARNGRPARPVYRCRASRGHFARDAHNLDAWVGSWISGLIARPAVLAALRETGPDTRALEVELAGIRDDLDELARQAGARQIDVRQMGITSRGLLERAGQIEQAISGASRAGVLAVLTAGSGPAVWDEMTLDGQRALLEALITVTVLPSPKGRTPGWRKGQPYFSTEYIQIDPKYKVPTAGS